MNTLEAISGRRSVRKYTDQMISDADIETLIQAALSAPSGLNLQPWYFVVVKSEEGRKKLDNIFEKVGVDIASELEGRFKDHPEIIAQTRQFISCLGNAPVVVLAFLLKDDYADETTAILSTAAACENLLIAARDMGIGSCWLTAANQTGFDKEIRETFAPGKGKLAATISLGYTENFPRAVRKKDGRYTIV